MVYVRFPVMKTGVNPSVKTMLDPMNMTPTQKVWMTKNRIWGNQLSGNERSGFKELCNFRGEAQAQYYDNSSLKMVYPFIDKWDEHNKKKMKYEERKSRIYMRGVKIGTKRGGGIGKSMGMFEKSTTKSAAEVQADTEADVKSKMSDEILKKV